MKRKRVIYVFAFGITLIIALNLVAFGSSETSMGNTTISGYEKAFDPGSITPSVKPGDDFYEYVNGAWTKNHPVPADKSRYGEFLIVEDRTYDHVKSIVESAANNTSAPKESREQKMGKFYIIGTDTATLEKQRLDPIKDELKMINNIFNISDVHSVSMKMMDCGIDPFFSMYAEPNKKNSTVMIATLTQGGLGLPDRDFYFRQDNESIQIREQYLTHVAKMFVFLGDSPNIAESNARTVMEIETKLANATFTNVENKDEVKTYNEMSLKELQAFAPGMNWSSAFSFLGQPEIAEVNVRNPSYFKELSTVIQEESITNLKTFLRWKLILATSPYLSSDLETEHFNFYEKELNGQQEMKPRWKRVLDAEYRAIGEDIGRVYVDKYFNSSSKAKMQEMVSNLKKAFRERIKNLPWMGPETKKEALMKLDVLDVQVGYPDEWLNYSELEVNNDSYVMNVLRASKFKFHHSFDGLDKIGKPVDHKLWEMNPQETNAYADFNKVLVVFPAGILQPPFFNKDADDAINYGAIGAIIGHEMTHHFDSQGRKFDVNGNLINWWTQKDADSFNQNTGILVDEYNRFEVLPGLHVNGNLTLQENIADFGGLTMAYHAYKLSLIKEPKIIDGFTGDQRFFLSFAQMWRQSETNEGLRMRALTDPHSPNRFRVNGVIFNVPEFYKAFPSVKPVNKLYRPENERSVIW
jgi:putative endopeptidase